MDENGFIKWHRVNRRINDGEHGIEIPVIRRELSWSYLGTDGYTYTQQKNIGPHGISPRNGFCVWGIVQDWFHLLATKNVVFRVLEIDHDD